MNILDKTKKNIFLTGPGGSGKTFIINEYIKEHPNTLLCGSTGTSAVNIGGVTAHKLFSIPVPAAGGNPEKLTASKFKIFAKTDTIIIDEISMIRNDVFSYLWRVLKRAEKIYDKKIRLIVVGDLYQLPPVVTENDKKLLTKYGFDKSGWCFTAKEWTEAKFKVIELDKIYRQTDEKFIKMLSYARCGNKRCLSYFNSFVNDDTPSDAIYICGTNKRADEINDRYFDSIDTSSFAYKAKKDGIVRIDICDDIILLKPDLKVMFTVNQSEEEFFKIPGKDKNDFPEYTNGMFGRVVECREKEVIVETENGKTITVKAHKFPLYDYKTDSKTATIIKNEIGSITQIPLTIAKAITIHKSQGKTFDNVVISPEIFAPGQLYVALSRIRDPKGLIITSPVLDDNLYVDPIVKKFIASSYEFKVSDAKLKKQKEIEKKQRSVVKKPVKRTKRKTKTSIKPKRTTKTTKTNKTTAIKTKRTTGIKKKTK